MSRNEIYVALSRATTSRNLKYKNISLDVFKVSGPCDEIIALQQCGKLNTTIPELKTTAFRIVFHGAFAKRKISNLSRLNGRDFYVLERLLALKADCLIVVYSAKKDFETFLCHQYPIFKNLFNNRLIIYGREISKPDHRYLKVRIPLKNKIEMEISINGKELKSRRPLSFWIKLRQINGCKLQRPLVEIILTTQLNVVKTEINDSLIGYNVTVFDVSL